MTAQEEAEIERIEARCCQRYASAVNAMSGPSGSVKVDLKDILLDALTKARQEKKDEIKTLRQALNKYGKHYPDCTVDKTETEEAGYFPYGCNCGLNNIFKETGCTQ